MLLFYAEFFSERVLKIG